MIYEQADLALSRLDEPYLPHRWMRIQAGLDFDSNVVLRGNGVDLPRDISDEKDGRAHWSTDFGWEFVRTPMWSVGLAPGYSGDANFELSRFNLHFPNISGWIDRRLDEVSFVRVRPHYGYAVRNGDPYVHTGGVELSYNHFFGDAGGAGRLFAEVTGNDFLFHAPSRPVTQFLAPPAGCVNCGFDGLDAPVRRARVRDGVEIMAGYEHRIRLAADTWLDTYLRGGIGGGHYASRGEEYQHDVMKLWIGARRELIADITMDVMASFAYTPYASPSTFVGLDKLVRDSCPVGGTCSLVLGNDREENVWNFRMLFERAFNDSITGTVRWHYQKNDSNTPTYDFERHIVGAYITIYYGD